MPNAASANLSLLISREQIGNAIGSALRLYVGRGRRYSVKQLANATGVKDRVIECALCDAGSLDYRPLPLEALVSVSSFLGSQFTSEWLSLAQQGAFDLPDGSEGDLDTAAIEAGEFQQAVQKARHPASPGGTAIVSQELGEIVPLARRSAASVQKVMAA